MAALPYSLISPLCSPLWQLGDFSSLFSIFFSSILRVLEFLCISQPIRTLSPGPARPRPLHLATVRCLDSVSQGSQRCRVLRLSAILSRFLLVPLLPSALPVLSLPSFRGALKTRPTETWFFFFFFQFILFYLICFYSHVSGNATTQQDVWIFFYSRRSIFLSSNATILPTLKQNSGPEQETSSCPLLQMSPGLTSTRLCSGSSLPFSSKTIPTASTAAHPTSPSVPSHHCDCMLLWKPFRQIFFSLIVNVVC